MSNKAKNAKRNARKKESQRRKRELAAASTNGVPSTDGDPSTNDDGSNRGEGEEVNGQNDGEVDTEVEYVASEEIPEGIDENFKSILEKFRAREEKNVVITRENRNENDERTDTDSSSAQTIHHLSKRQTKKSQRLTVAELKQLVTSPELVETHDVTSPDPPFLIYLKSTPMSVSVPRHWAQKRKYLQGKRGVEKPAFCLPKYIEDTGIAEIRGTVQDDEAKSSIRQQGRQRVAPKMGKIDIDYKTLHDAFFKYQTRPPLTPYGTLYYEGKEFEQDMSKFRPGVLSEALKAALGMGEGMPVPWLINMQRHGPPPSYPNLKIPGLNAPLPPGASFGYHPGGWGKPPVDEFNRPLYPGVFANPEAEKKDELGVVYTGTGMVVRKNKGWGALPKPGDDDYESESSEEEESEEESGSEESGSDDDGDDDDGTKSGTRSSTTNGFDSVQSELQLRKGASDGDETPKELYTVLETKERTAAKGEVFGSDVTYVLPGQGGGDGTETVEGAESVIKKGEKKRKRGGDDEEDDGGKKFKF